MLRRDGSRIFDWGVHFRAPARMIPCNCMRPERSAKRSAEGAEQGSGAQPPSGVQGQRPWRGLGAEPPRNFLIILDHFTHSGTKDQLNLCVLKYLIFVQNL